MDNPFEAAAVHIVVVSDTHGHMALWPDFVAPPTGWAISYGPASREKCLAYLHNRAHADR